MDEPRTPRGWLSLYVVAFALVLASAALVVVGVLERLSDDSLRLLRISSVLSAAAIVAAVISVVLPRRR